MLPVTTVTLVQTCPLCKSRNIYKSENYWRSWAEEPYQHMWGSGGI